jgi:hypothetical protein
VPVIFVAWLKSAGAGVDSIGMSIIAHVDRMARDATRLVGLGAVIWIVMVLRVDDGKSRKCIRRVAAAS